MKTDSDMPIRMNKCRGEDLSGYLSNTFWNVQTEKAGLMMKIFRPGR